MRIGDLQALSSRFLSQNRYPWRSFETARFLQGTEHRCRTTVDLDGASGSESKGPASHRPHKQRTTCLPRLYRSGVQHLDRSCNGGPLMRDKSECLVWSAKRCPSLKCVPIFQNRPALPTNWGFSQRRRYSLDHCSALLLLSRSQGVRTCGFKSQCVYPCSWFPLAPLTTTNKIT